MRSEDGVDIPDHISLLQLITDAVAYPVDFVRIDFLLVAIRGSTRLASSRFQQVV
jgi:hypothetical protein